MTPGQPTGGRGWDFRVALALACAAALTGSGGVAASAASQETAHPPSVWTASSSLHDSLCTHSLHFGARQWPPGCWRPYADSSPFNLPVPDHPQLHPDSAAIVRRLMGWGSPQNLLAGHADTEADFYHPIFWSTFSDPIYTVHCVKFTPCAVEGHRLRIPAQARAAAGGDGHLAVMDQTTGWEYDFWQVRRKPENGGTLVVSHGGRTRTDGSGLGSNATAAWFGLAAGVVRAQELEAGEIDHALFAAVRCSSGVSVYPAQQGTSGAHCNEFGISDKHAPPMGARLWLDMSDEEIGALQAPEWQKTLLSSMAKYGMLVGDTLAGHGSWGIQGDSGSSYTSFGSPDPWRRLAVDLGASPYGVGYAFNIGHGVDWAGRLRVLSPCVSQQTC